MTRSVRTGKASAMSSSFSSSVEDRFQSSPGVGDGHARLRTTEGPPQPARASEPADTSPPSWTWSVRPTVPLFCEPISQCLRWTVGSLGSGFWNSLSRSRSCMWKVTKKHGRVDVLRMRFSARISQWLYFPPAGILEISVTQPTVSPSPVEDTGTLPLCPLSAQRVSWARVGAPAPYSPPFSPSPENPGSAGMDPAWTPALRPLPDVLQKTLTPCGHA